MKYKNIIESSKNNDVKTIWDSVDRISDFLEVMKEKDPKAVKCFLKKEYEEFNGKHFNEWYAKKIVNGMFHYDNNGNRIAGELVSFEKSQYLINDIDVSEREKWSWDIYVGANGFMHDFADMGINEEQILRMAKKFWLNDDDFEDNKIFWYFERLM